MPSIDAPTAPHQPTNAAPSEIRAHYQKTLPYVRAHDGSGQWELWGDGSPGPMELEQACKPSAELVAAIGDVDEDQLALFDRNGTTPARRWRRDSAGGEHRSWSELDRALAARARFSGRAWCDGDQRTLADAYAQTYGPVEAARVWTHQAWLVDLWVCPITGEALRMPGGPCRRIVDVLVAAYDAGAGGVLQSHDDWAAMLGCSVRSVHTYMRRLIAIGAVREIWTRREHPKHGTVYGHKLYRVGPMLARYLAILAASRRQRSSAAVKAAGRMLRAELNARAARRRFDISGATYRGRWGLAESTRSGDRRTRPYRQNLPHSPPLPGLATRGPAEQGPEIGSRFARSSIASRRLVAPPGVPAFPLPAASSSDRAGARLEGEGSAGLAELARRLAGALGFDPPDLPTG